MDTYNMWQYTADDREKYHIRTNAYSIVGFIL